MLVLCRRMMIRALIRENFHIKSLILLVCTSDIPRSRVFCFYIEESILPQRKWQTKITEKKIDPINYKDHCSGLLRSGEGGSDKLVEHRLPNLPVQKLCTHRKNMRILEHKQTNNNPMTMNKKLTFRKFFS